MREEEAERPESVRAGGSVGRFGPNIQPIEAYRGLRVHITFRAHMHRHTRPTTYRSSYSSSSSNSLQQLLSESLQTGIKSTVS